VKKGIAIVSLSIVVILAAGNFLIYKTFISSYKKEFRSWIFSSHNASMSQLAINPSALFVNSQDLLWEDENKEIIYNGELYDVVGRHNEHGKVILTLVNDKNELDLNKEFASGFDDSKNSSGLLKILKQFLGLKFLGSQNDLTLQDPFSICSFSELTSLLSNGFADGILQPPAFS
jgi:hypothetical protein